MRLNTVLLLRRHSFLYPLAEILQLVSSRNDRLPVFDAAKPEMSAALYLKVSVKMLDGLYEALALFHIRACTKHNGIAFFPF